MIRVAAAALLVLGLAGVATAETTVSYFKVPAGAGPHDRPCLRGAALLDPRPAGDVAEW